MEFINYSGWFVNSLFFPLQNALYFSLEIKMFIKNLSERRNFHEL